jgi:hypothetical protein
MSTGNIDLCFIFSHTIVTTTYGRISLSHILLSPHNDLFSFMFSIFFLPEL